MGSQINDSLHALSEFVDTFESKHGTIGQVDVEIQSNPAESLSAELSVPLCLCANSDQSSDVVLIDISDIAFKQDSIRLCGSIPAVESIRSSSVVSIEDTDVTQIDEELKLIVTLSIDPASSTQSSVMTTTSDQQTASRTVENRGGSERQVGVFGGITGSQSNPTHVDSEHHCDEPPTGNADQTVIHALEDARSEDIPAYDDTAYLRELYNRLDTFEQMAERIELDVSGETVRRYMIDAGIHSPTTYQQTTTQESQEDTASSPDNLSDDSGVHRSDEQRLLADGRGMPDQVTAAELAEAVIHSQTVYQVRRRLSLDDDETRQLLRRFNLLDLVIHRVNKNTQHNTTYDDVIERIQQRLS